ncbi:thioredoxin family protein [Geodermatophilus sp. SYSU D00525]
MGADGGGADVVACPRCGRRNRVPATARGRPRCAACGADLPWLVAADDTDFSAVVEDGPLPVLVDVWAAWCAPCRAVAPVVEEIARERAGRLKVVQVDADAAPRVSGRLGVRGIPTLLLFAGGREQARVTGALPAPALRRWLDDALAAAGR